MIENIKSNINVINDKCATKNIENFELDFYFSNKISNTSIYSYEIDSVDEIKFKYNNLTFVEISKEQKKKLMNKFNLDENEKLYVFIYDTPNNNSRSIINDYNYIFILEKGTILNFTEINKDFYVNISSPIRNLSLANFDLLEKFSQNGYDIYNKNSNFYNDICSPASINGNDITLKDRKEDISFQESKDTFIDYFLGNINYKIFKCYKLFFNFNNLKKCYPFYILIITFMFIQVFNCIYLFYSLKRLKIELGKEMLSNKRIILDKISKLNKRSNNKIVKLNKKKNKGTIIYKNKKSISNNVKNLSKSERNTYIFLLNNNTIINNGTSDIEHLSMKPIKKKKESFDNYINEERDSDKKDSNNKNNKENINELPYSKAIRVDKRNIFIVFYSILIDKLELLHIISSDNKIKIILFEEFVISLVFNFFINSLLYTDDIVSNKYHNNGELDLVVTLTLSLLSNIITSKFCYYTKYTSGIDEKIELIVDIRYEIPYYINLKKFFLYLKLKFILFFIFQIFIFAISSYYIVIFCILYSKSRESLIINYCYSLIESIITAFGISLIILVTRKIGLVCLNKELYNFSKFINYKF